MFVVLFFEQRLRRYYWGGGQTISDAKTNDHERARTQVQVAQCGNDKRTNDNDYSTDLEAIKSAAKESQWCHDIVPQASDKVTINSLINWFGTVTPSSRLAFGPSHSSWYLPLVLFIIDIYTVSRDCSLNDDGNGKGASMTWRNWVAQELCQVVVIATRMETVSPVSWNLCCICKTLSNF